MAMRAGQRWQHLLLSLLGVFLLYRYSFAQENETSTQRTTTEKKGGLVELSDVVYSKGALTMTWNGQTDANYTVTCSHPTECSSKVGVGKLSENGYFEFKIFSWRLKPNNYYDITITGESKGLSTITNKSRILYRPMSLPQNFTFDGHDTIHFIYRDKPFIDTKLRVVVILCQHCAIKEISIGSFESTTYQNQIYRYAISAYIVGPLRIHNGVHRSISLRIESNEGYAELEQRISIVTRARIGVLPGSLTVTAPNTGSLILEFVSHLHPPSYAIIESKSIGLNLTFPLTSNRVQELDLSSRSTVDGYVELSVGQKVEVEVLFLDVVEGFPVGPFKASFTVAGSKESWFTLNGHLLVFVLALLGGLSLFVTILIVGWVKYARYRKKYPHRKRKNEFEKEYYVVPEVTIEKRGVVVESDVVKKSTEVRK